VKPPIWCRKTASGVSMIGRGTVVFAAALAALSAGCALPHQDVAMRGTADWVLISYAGDVSDTLPIARRHCAQYEREPVFQQTKDNSALYRCVKPGAPL
jgi:hypothetical protein